MYGLVNKAIKDLVCEKFGQEKWEAIAREANFEDPEFVGLQSYPDQLTYDLVKSSSKVLGVDANIVLEAFGEYWILFTADEGYGNLMQLAGDSLPDFLNNLDMLHTRLSNLMPNLAAPQFSTRNVQANSLELEYRSHRKGLEPMVVGLLRGLGKRFEMEVKVQQIADSESDPTCRVFHVSW